jgi:P27 family predicted phage terminase small subunit
VSNFQTGPKPRAIMTNKRSKTSTDSRKRGSEEAPQAQSSAEPSAPDTPAAQSNPLSDLECPKELPPLAVEEWNRIVGELTVLGILSRFDRGPLAIYCGAYAAWAEAFEAMQKYGMMIKSPTGYPVQSPYMAIMNRQAEIMLRIAGEFGFTPASRGRNFSYAKSQSMLLLEPQPQPSSELPPLDLGR